MANAISERDLILPAVWCIKQSEDNVISTTELQDCLRELLNPVGEDLVLLKNRNDDKFSQKVRNLTSHNTLERLNFATYEKRANNGYWSLTEQGETFLIDNFLLIEYLLSNRFDYSDAKEAFKKVEVENKGATEVKRRIVIFDERTVINEGERVSVERQTYTRSKKLREVAIQHYSKDSGIVCQACSFDFKAVYGELGEGYIEIHHIKPVLAYEGDDLEKVIQEALSNVVPLCSNCHRMVHRRKGYVLPVDELAEIINTTKKQ